MSRMIQALANINMLWEYISFFFVVFKVDLRENSIKRNVGLSACLLIWITGLVFDLQWMDINIGPLPVFVILIFAMIYFIFDMKLPELILTGIGQWLFLSMFEELFFIILENVVIDKFIKEYIILGTVTGVIWALYILLDKKRGPKSFRLPKRMWVVMDLIMAILTAMISFFTYVILKEVPGNKMMITGKYLALVGEALIFVLLIVLIYYYNCMHSYRMEKEHQEKLNEQQREYFNQLLERENETKKFRHEIVNDLLEMQYFCKEKKCTVLKSYLEDTLGIVQSISKNNYDVGNDIVNTVLNYYLKPINEKCEIDISGYMGDDLSIDQRDLCVLSANLIKNASEAIEKTENGMIKFSVEQGKKFLVMKTVNTFDGDLRLDKTGKVLTTKKDAQNHGFGIENIKSVVKKYKGTYDARVVDGMYQAEISLRL